MKFEITSLFIVDRRCRLLLLASLATPIFTVIAGNVLGQTHKIISPSFYADVEGEGADTDVGSLTRSQQVFPAEDFAHLEAGTYAITQFAWRPDGALEGPHESVYGDITIEMALTDKTFDPGNPGPNGEAVLSHTFAENYLTDPVIVREGEAVITTENQVSDNGVTKEFDQVVEFDRPFLYDPSDGNLLIEYRVHQGNNVATLADFTGAPDDMPPNWMVLARNPNGEVADVIFRGFVMEFTMHRVPEPASWSLLVLSLIGIGSIRKR